MECRCCVTADICMPRLSSVTQPMHSNVSCFFLMKIFLCCVVGASVTGGELFEDIVAREFYSEADARYAMHVLISLCNNNDNTIIIIITSTPVILTGIYSHMPIASTSLLHMVHGSLSHLDCHYQFFIFWPWGTNPWAKVHQKGI